MANAQAARDRARADLDRLQQLFADGAVSAQQLESARLTAVNAQLPALTILTVIAGVSAVLLLANVWARTIWLLVVTSALCIAPWVARNSTASGVARLTTADPINLVVCLPPAGGRHLLALVGDLVERLRPHVGAAAGLLDTST